MFFVSHDDFSPDTPANRAIRSAISKISRMRLSPRTAARTNRAAFAFEEIPESGDWKKDVAMAKI